MPLTCNIDARGKRYRLLMGLFLTLAGILTAALWAWPVGGWRWLVSAVLLVSGLFGIFEARAGWCAVRAMGFKTRI